MGNLFLININVSNILDCNENTVYTMLIDDSKMTIVYELTEWIRWIFSLKKCFFLVHENSIIHDLEDIKVLSLLKTLKIQFCSQTNCIHKQGYKNLLDKFNVFVEWGELKIPKLFYEKLSNMSKKYNTQNSFDGLTTNKTISELRNPIKSDLNFQLDVNNSMCSNQSEIVINGEDKKITCNNIKDEPNKLLTEETSSPTDMINIFQGDIKKQLVKFPDLDNHPSCISNVRFERINKEKIDTFSNLKNENRFLRPFSLGRILENLRNNVLKENKEQVSDEVYDIISSSRQHDSKVLSPNSQCSAEDYYLPIPQKKRKRVRKHKSKKQKLLTIEENEVNSTKNNLKEECVKKKSSHIRFESDNESTFNIDNTFENKNPEEGLFNTNNFEKYKVSENGTKNDTEEESGKNGKRQILSSNISSNTSIIDNYVTESLTPMNQEEAEQIDVSEKEEFISKNKLKANDLDINTLKTLMGLKQQFPHPVAIERFY